MNRRTERVSSLRKFVVCVCERLCVCGGVESSKQLGVMDSMQRSRIGYKGRGVEVKIEEIMKTVDIVSD
jgi:hypothetical protein